MQQTEQNRTAYDRIKKSYEEINIFLEDLKEKVDGKGESDNGRS